MQIGIRSKPLTSQLLRVGEFIQMLAYQSVVPMDALLMCTYYWILLKYTGNVHKNNSMHLQYKMVSNFT